MCCNNLQVLKLFKCIVVCSVRICQVIFIPVIVFFGNACSSPTAGSENSLLDSLLKATVDLQDRISSSEIQQLGDLYREIEEDLNQLNKLSGLLSADEQILLNNYLALDSLLGECFGACSKFHEELFIIETDLQELHSLYEKRQTDTVGIENRILAEKSLLEEFSGRLESAITLVPVHMLHFNELKPGIDSVIARRNDLIGTDE